MKQIILLILIAFFSSCGVYSFTGASVAPGVKTISIKYFPNYAALVQPTLSSAFTEALQKKFTSQSSLHLVDKNGDLNIEGSIIGYAITPIAPQSNDKAAMSRLTITVNVKFTNKIDPKQNFEQSFSRYADLESTKSFASSETDLITQIDEILTDDVFNKALANW